MIQLLVSGSCLKTQLVVGGATLRLLSLYDIKEQTGPSRGEESRK